MTTPFAGGSRITQEFGERPGYYAQFGLAGHEGVDAVPKDGNRNVFAIEAGIVVRDQDDAVDGKAYGIYVVIFSPVTKHRWTYAHLSYNTVRMGQRVARGERIGEMGATGNTEGAHLHLGLKLTDANGAPLNANDGYQGNVDPTGFVEQLNELEEDVLRRASEAQPWMPVNHDAALWKFAQAQDLEDQQTIELGMLSGGVMYWVQVFNKGIAYVQDGVWDNIQFIAK